MIDGIKTKQLTTHPDDRGFFREVWRADDGFAGEVKQTSVTKSYPGIVKAFHWHTEQDDVWYVFEGTIRIALYDRRSDSPTYGEKQEIFAGEDNPIVVFIPHGVAHGYQVIGNKPAVLFYHTSNVYDASNPDEHRIPFDDKDIDFDWSIKNR